MEGNKELVFFVNGRKVLLVVCGEALIFVAGILCDSRSMLLCEPP